MGNRQWVEIGSCANVLRASLSSVEPPSALLNRPTRCDGLPDGLQLLHHFCGGSSNTSLCSATIMLSSCSNSCSLLARKSRARSNLALTPPGVNR